MSTVRPVGLFAAPVAIRGKRQHSRLTVYGRWLLNLTDGPELLAAEVQLIETKFKCLCLFVSAPEAGACEQPILDDALTFLISSLFLMTQADQLKVLSWSGKANGSLSQLSCVTERQLWTPYESMARLAGSDDAVKMTALIIDPIDWWQEPFAAKLRDKLSYLERRVMSAAEKSPCPTPKRKRSWLRPWG